MGAKYREKCPAVLFMTLTNLRKHTGRLFRRHLPGTKAVVAAAIGNSPFPSLKKWMITAKSQWTSRCRKREMLATPCRARPVR